MQIWMTLILAAQMLSALTMIGLVLIQHGKGADMGASFGSGASGSLFGATGSANFLSRATAACATVFFAARWRWPSWATPPACAAPTRAAVCWTVPRPQPACRPPA
jgi:preprotein translocase subunit SecG